MRLIDADALKRYIDCGHLRSPTKKVFSELDVVRMLDKSPTIDLITSVHAYWYGTEYDGFSDGFPVYDGWACSNCNEEFYNEGDPPSCNFCPNCGARMDGDPHDSGQ